MEKDIHIIVAASNNDVIGKDGKLPWNLPSDLRHFKNLTINNMVIMGRLTYESIGKPLPGRFNVIITRDPEYKAPGCFVVDSLEKALNTGYQGKMFVIGGECVIEDALPLANTLHLTRVLCDVEGDSYFRGFNPDGWLYSESEIKEENGFKFQFQKFIR